VDLTVLHAINEARFVSGLRCDELSTFIILIKVSDGVESVIGEKTPHP